MGADPDVDGELGDPEDRGGCQRWHLLLAAGVPQPCSLFHPAQGRPHTALDGQIPDMVYFAPLPQREAAERELRRASRSTPRFLSNSLGPPLMAREGAARKPRGGFPASMIGEATCEDQAYRAP